MDTKPHYDNEKARIEERRETLQLAPVTSRKAWGLALSGGGIRSATFCLGVLQAMARANAPAPAPANEENAELGGTLLPRFDYLSTVSGGGYIGSFFASLFVTDRLRKPQPPAAQQSPMQAASDAYKVLRFEPPGRISTGTDYQSEDVDVGKGPTAWLRENGRYLTPTGSGDMLYALAMTWRNWLSLHFVIGMPIVLLLSLLVLLQLTVVPNLFVLPALVFVLGLLPAALAYWLVIPRDSLSNPPALSNLAAKAAVAAVLTLIGLWVLLNLFTETSRVTDLLLGFAAIAALAVGYARYMIKQLKDTSREAADKQASGTFTVRNYRVQITRQLSVVLMILAGSLFAACLVTLSEAIYLRLGTMTLGSAGALPVLIWLVRKLALLQDEKTLPGWVRKLPLDVIGLIGGSLLLALVCLVWMLFVLWIAADGSVRVHEDGNLLRLVLLVIGAGALIWVASRFVGFLNTSSLQGFYASRLARAYLGASNGKRFEGTAEQRRSRMSVAEPLTDDDISVKRYYAPNAGPLHLINMTMNLTIDPAEQLVQRDRKGKPLCLAPGRNADGTFILDGKAYPRAPDNGTSKQSEIAYPLTIGQWIGVSGAAFTTGLGRTTSLGLSLLLGLANVRLGNWWPSRFVDDTPLAATPAETGPADSSAQPAPPKETLGLKMSRWLPTQTYLFYEMTAHFHGHRRDYQYLSDGGHFENTAAYELLRPERKVELIVICDCGCDPDYRFDDLANFIRLARIDHGLDIQEDPGIVEHDVLNKVFARLSDFKQPPSTADNRCAILLNVYSCTGTGKPVGAPISRILVLKPRMIAAVSPDVFNYAQANASFPNQTTVDQFFDEAQFESYRKLGLSIGQRVFGDDSQNQEVAQALWQYLGTATADSGATQPPSAR